MAVMEIARIQVRRGIENQSGVPQLSAGEFGWAQDTEHLYIGKRVSEGATADSNSRVLTERDLTNIFALITNTVTQVISYNYRNNISYIQHAEPRNIQSKFDDTVSLSDYGIEANTLAVDITAKFNRILQEIMSNSTSESTQRAAARRAIIVPAGVFVLNEVVSLPPYTTLIGAGIGLTTIILNTPNANMFKSVDADGFDFESSLMQSGVNQARDISISHMTLQFGNNVQSDFSLLRLDNVRNSTIDYVEFKSSNESGFRGMGLTVNGTAAGPGIELATFPTVTNCIFDGIENGIAVHGTVVSPKVLNNKFKNLVRGIVLDTTGSTSAASNGDFDSNHFENIQQQGIYSSPSVNRTNHISHNNVFVQVGNGTSLDDFTNVPQHPVIEFNSSGNRSVDDYFQRQTEANSTTDANFYYNPLVKGHTAVRSAATTTVDVLNKAITPILKFSLLGLDQMITMHYQLTNASLSRKGTLLINIASDGYTTVSDSYSYTESVDASIVTTDMAFAIVEQFSNNYVELVCDASSTTLDSQMEYQTDAVS